MAIALKIPRPHHFFKVWSLRTGTTMILFAMVLNKATALYAILAPFTGHPLSMLQADMYIYSLPILAICVYLTPHVRKIPPSPIHTIALAYTYVIDTVISAAFTAAFGVAWFMVLAQHPKGNSISGAGTMDATSGFTSPEHHVSAVDVVATPAPGLLGGQDAVAAGVPADFPVRFVARGIADAVMDRGSIMSLFFIGLLWAVRFYFCTVVLGYARAALRAHIATVSTSTSLFHDGAGASDADAKQNPDRVLNPFHESKPDGQGLKGRIGRLMLKIAPDYWLGKDGKTDEEGWVRGIDGKFNGRRGLDLPNGGVPERERRRRAGTGPPDPSPGLSEAANAPQ